MSKRRLARENCLQALYKADIAHLNAREALSQMQSDCNDCSGFCEKLFSAAMAHLKEIDSVIAKVSLNWDIARMPAVDRAVLRMSVCEMIIIESAPVPVIIDEAIELAKKYSTDKSGKFVNGVLDQVARYKKLIK